ncbi:MAG TPA: tetratricopeptide repeat protein, partial [Thermoplasmataceae archaeon]|nr:tetratricopeptide repeat protein [Thermoplasmataceae archaeon]
LKKLVSKNDLSPKIMGNALVLQSLNYYDLGMLDEQLAVSEEALRIAEEYGLEDVIADALNGIANVKIKKYEIDEAEALYKKALDINRRLRKMDRILLTNNNLAIIWSYKGQMKESADLLKEVIEGSYITGDIQSRAYASYNISEIYFNAGEFGEAMKYIPYALKLVQKLNDTNLSFPFYRFLVTISISLFRLRMAKQYVGELLSVANVVGDQRMIRQAEGLNTLIGVIEGNVPENTLDSFFDIELREGDDYTPIWYSIGVMHFSLSRKLNKAEECLKKSREAAQHLGDYYGSLISHVAEIYILLAKGDSEKILSFIRDMRESGRKLLIFENQMRLIEGLYKSEKGSTAEYTPESILDLIGATEFEHLSLKRKGGAVYDLLRKRYYAAMELRTGQQGVI